MRRLGALAAAVVLALAMAGCDDDGAGSCDGCRVLGVGTDADVDGTSIGVRQCADGTCELALAAADGTEQEVHVLVGDTVDVGAGWVVVDVTGDSLTIRPA